MWGSLVQTAWLTHHQYMQNLQGVVLSQRGLAKQLFTYKGNMQQCEATESNKLGLQKLHIYTVTYLHT
jgi:hypothetical protein